MKRRSAAELSSDLLGKDLSVLSDLERDVIDRIANRRVSALESDAAKTIHDGFGARLADRVAEIGGSWSFIIGFALVLFGWMLLNSPVLGMLGIRFDPYPFIFLNLMLSTLAAIQAPIIMMSQNRQAAKDRLTAEHDYQVNMRAELEIIMLHEKLEHIIAELDQMKKDMQ